MVTRLLILTSMVALLATSTSVHAFAADAPNESAKQDAPALRVPPGFVVERIAGPPLVNRPIVADFDERGRLYVADSSGSNDPVQKQLAEKPHRVVRLEDSDGDGRFDRSTVFASGMMFPEGAMWRGGSLYVSAPPSIWKLTDTNDDGVADVREEWFQGKTLTGCANDLHGPYAGPDGWIYWCKGAFAEQTYARPGTKPLVTRAAHIFRARADGTGIEPVMTGGMDNPVDVVFMPGGERIFTTTFLQHPGGGKRDGLIHAVYGGVYGKDHDPVYTHPWTGPDLMPALVHLGPAAPCGLTRYESGGFGAEWRDNLFACQFNMHKVSRHVLTAKAASFTATDEEFLASDHGDFHPTDVIEDADGSVLVIDTGGWYKLCCPTSQLSKPDVLGAIYRVRREGVNPPADPRGLAIPWGKATSEELANFLGDSRFAVRARAIALLGERRDDALVPLQNKIARGGSALERANAVWAATRIDSPAARSAVRQALRDESVTVRQVALHSISLWRDRDALASAISLLQDSPAQNQRAAAEALGRMGDPSAVPALLAAADQVVPSDRFLEHSIIYALIEINHAKSTAEGLVAESERTRRAALIALDQMEAGAGLIERKRVVAWMSSGPATLRQAARWVVGRHADWGDVIADALKERVARTDLGESEREELASLLAGLAGGSEIQALLTDVATSEMAGVEGRMLALRAMSRAQMKSVPTAWVACLTDLLGDASQPIVARAIECIQSLPIKPESAAGLRERLVAIAAKEDAPELLRLSALAAMPGGPGAISNGVLSLLKGQLDSARPVTDRLNAADVLAKAKLTPSQLQSLAESVRSIGPMELGRLLGVFGSSGDDAVGRALVSALAKSPALTSVRVDALKPIIDKYGPDVRHSAEELYRMIEASASDRREQLEKLLGLVNSGDIRRGQQAFNGVKAACASCHAIGYLGGNVGPDLTRIGAIRSERDLVESILFPSASFVRSYEPMVVATKDGRVISGVLRKDAADEVVLATSATEQVRIPREDIDEMRPGEVSVMPAGLDKQLSARELADLVAFLKACR